ncbi:hypothetical protein [Pseudomonas sp. UFMG81]|uniref:hypothetical protein n=1 Tax=Pseudomonas sp. UFMG81 TaxID=2745936 RepID=UPI0018908706|nr:hypothetical protein [Pseudomonas sp. UFMG81]
MNTLEEKVAFVEQLLLMVREIPYKPERCANLAFVSSLDHQSYRYGDIKLDEIVGLIQGVSEGEGFYYSQGELVEMLEPYLHELKV